MMRRAIQDLGVYGALAAMAPKRLLTYNLWFWLELFVRTLSIVILVFFWRAVYANTESIGGVSFQQTLNYILLAQVFMPMVQFNLLAYFGQIVLDGSIATELLRPVNFQASNYAQSLTSMATLLFMNLPVGLIAWLFFGLQLPGDPLVWLCFAVSLLLGQIALFFFDWTLGCFAFYSQEVWGLGVLRYGVALFFSGALVPLTMLPEWLQRVAAVLPFRLGLYVPLAFLTGMTPVADAPRIWLMQVAWAIGLGILSHRVFAVAVRKVTVHGG